CALALVASGAWAQGRAAAIVEYSSGDDLIVIRDGRRLPGQDAIGLELYQGDQVQTGKGVFVELRLSSGGSVIKLSENTTFILERLSDGQTSMQLVYGRVRAKVEKLTGTEAFSLRSSQAVAGVRGTDFGLDVVASRLATASMATNVYCFEGSVEVTAFVKSDAQAAESLEAIPRAFVIAAGEMVRVEGSAGKAEATRGAVEQSIKDFWSANDYSSVSSVLAPVAAPVATGAPAAAATVAPAAAATVAPAAGAAEDSASLTELYEAGYDRGYADAKARFEPAPDFLPEGALGKEGVAAFRASARLQKGGIIAGGLCGLGGAGLAVTGFILTQAGDAAGGTVMLETGAVLSAMAIPFLALSLLVRY
ncbi:MAG: FecR family protein, partial [Spirochaetes bacterium]|nr:FecR family protein [Spirochaetota bacterium]